MNSTGAPAVAGGPDAIALGENTHATGANSVALGANSVADEDNTVSVGSAGNERRITNVATGEDDTDAVNVAQLEEVAGDLGDQITNIDNRVTLIENSLGNINRRFGRVRKEASAGTAAAMAMSGNTFLPDNKFNLSANVATYDGAWAGALEVGALVSPHAAFNAGISGAFNHHGKVGARMGMTFGW